jgi:hypothetical protein
MQFKEAYAAEITKLLEYVDSKEDPLIQIARCTITTSTQQCNRQLDSSI